MTSFVKLKVWKWQEILNFEHFLSILRERTYASLSVMRVGYPANLSGASDCLRVTAKSLHSRFFSRLGTTSSFCGGHGVMYKVIPLVFTFYCWTLVSANSSLDYCGRSQGFANHRQQGRLGSLFYSFFNLPTKNYRRPKIVDGSVSKKDSWPWQVSWDFLTVRPKFGVHLGAW